MSVITDTWRQLVRRRLWPVALLLVGALVAVPMILAKEPEPAPVAPVPGAAKAPAAADADPIVALANADEARRRRVLGASKDPFAPAPVKAGKAAATPDATAETPVPSEGSSPATGGSGAPTADVPSATVPGTTVPEAPKPTYPLYTLTVRFGSTEAPVLDKSKLKRLEALPSADDPVLVYLGVQEGGKVAVFMVDSGIDAQGDGVCQPDPASCETIHMREGDTEFFDVSDDEGNVVAQYELDLVDIKTKKTASAAEARKSYAKVSKAGKRVVHARTAARGPLRYRYNARRGVVERLGKKAFKAAVARSAVAVAGGFDVTR
jgi:hypothetical protein